MIHMMYMDRLELQVLGWTPVCQWDIATMSVLCLREDVQAIYIDTILQYRTCVSTIEFLNPVFVDLKYVPLSFAIYTVFVQEIRLTNLVGGFIP